MPDRPPDIIEKLREADGELRKEQLSQEADRRIREILAGEAKRPSPWLRLVWAPVAAAVVVLLVWALWPRHPSTEEPRPQLAGFKLTRGEVDREQGKRLRCRTASCTLEAPGIETRLELSKHCVVTRSERAIQLVRGELTVEVKPRPQGKTVRVLVSHGVVEVTGTRFTLRQDPEGGWVKLERGAIRYVSNDGRTVALRPGQRLDWPLPPREPPTTQPVPPPQKNTPLTQHDAGSPSTPEPKKPRPGPLDEQATQALLEQVERLRSQQRYARAARLLRKSLPRIADRTTRERLSYELGSLLTYQLKQNDRACRHWKRHLRSFSPTRYRADVERARKLLDCR
jgi:transmembrane sensor